MTFGLKEVIIYLENNTETGDGDSAGNEGYLSTATKCFFFNEIRPNLISFTQNYMRFLILKCFS